MTAASTVHTEDGKAICETPEEPVIGININNMSAASTVNTEDGKVICKTPEGKVIDININKQSCLDGLLESIKIFGVVKNIGDDKKPDRQTGSAVLLGAGASFISLGCFVVVLAVIFAVAKPNLYFWTYGTFFWVGFPFIGCGVLNVVAYRYPKAFWEVLAFISMLVSLAVSIAATFLISNDNGWTINLVHLCENVSQSRYPHYYDQFFYGNAPRYYQLSEWEMESCKRGFHQAQNLLFGLDVMSLLMMIWGLCLSSIILGYRLEVVLAACKCENMIRREDRNESSLIPSPTEEISIA